MLCPKCGQEYEGSQCPRCDGPVIKVNNSDYLARKKAYEERLKNKNIEEEKKKEEEESNKDFDLIDGLDKAIDSLKENATSKDRTKKISKGVKNVAGKYVDALKNIDVEESNSFNNIKTKKASDKTKKNNKHKYNKKRIIVPAVLLTLVVVAIVAIVKLVNRKNYDLYFSYNDKIYNVKDLESSYVCDEADAVFAIDNKTYYKVNRDDLAGETLQSLASDDGKYVAFVQYIAEDDNYKITVKSNDKSVDIALNNKAKELVDFRDDGSLIYSEYVVLNQEGGRGKKSLTTAYINEDLTYQTTEISDDISKFYDYRGLNSLVCVDNSGNLFTYNYNSKKKNELLENVTNIIAMSNENHNYYSYSAALVNSWEKCDTFVYTVGYNYYLYDIKDEKSYKITKSLDSNVEFIMDNTNEYAYAFNSNTVYKAKLNSKEFGEFEEIDSLNTARNIVYNYYTKELFYINKDSNLVRLKKGETKTIAENVLDGSLTLVRNDTKSLSYISEGSIYYLSDSNAKARALYTADNLRLDTNMIRYKNRLYFYANEETLYSTNIKGKDLNEIGNIKRFWLGSKLK